MTVHFMKRSILLLLAIAATVSAGPAQYRYEPQSRVTTVTVYPDRALVERVAEVDLRPGETTLVLKDLPANLWDHSLQVSGTGPTGTNVVDVQSRNVFLESEPSPEIRELEKKLEALRHDQRRLEDELAALDYDRTVLDRISDAATTLPTEGDAPRPSFDDWRELLKFNAEENRRLQSDRRENARKTEDLLAKIAAAERQLQEARGRLPGRRAVKEVTIRLGAEANGTGKVTVAYTLPGASWTPTYRARLDSTTRRVMLDYQAQVINRTGDAWQDVALTLSTARPSAGGSAPEPRPWIVEETKPQPEYAQRKGGFLNQLSRTTAAVSDMAMQEAAPNAAMEIREATVESGLTSATFKIASPTTIPADGTMHKVAVTTLDLSTGLRYATTPKYQEAAFLSAKVTNTTEFPLLAGSMAAFVDGAFISNSHLEATMAGEEFELALGVDDAVTVERTLINRFVEKTGFTNSGTRVTYEIALNLTNHKSIPVSIELTEPLPVSRHEKIVVKLIEPADRDVGTDGENKAFTRDEEGILTWAGSLAAGASRELTLKFSIEHPNDLDVSGVE